MSHKLAFSTLIRQSLLSDKVQHRLRVYDSGTQNITDYISSGKQVRPLMFLYVYSALSGKMISSLHVKSTVCAIEIAHRSTLVSDDVADNQVERNNRPSIYGLMGLSVASLSSQFLQTIAMDICPKKYRSCLNTAIYDTMNGQLKQVFTNPDKLAVALRDYREIVCLKSGSIGRFAIAAGFLMAKRPVPPEIDELSENLAMAYQVCNDLADVMVWLQKGDDELIADVKQGSMSFPLLIAMGYHHKPEFLLKLYQNKQIADMKIFRELFEKHPIIEDSLDQVRGFIENSKRILYSLLPINEYSTELTQYLLDKWVIVYSTKEKI
ncbi:MAG: polyprenyl synthetase family protein [Candidatus Cloacimonadaceae bacterium]|nr:polyprenyl synthetase family protein [Candidatus Cloacimonadaceae bacterium]